MKKKAVSIVLVGITGMGQSYLEILLAGFPPEEIVLDAVVEPYPERSAYLSELQDRKIPVLPTLAAAYENRAPADLVVICSPIQHHVSQSCLALEQGSHVLCEKPVGATVQDARHLIEVEERTGLWVMMGYQWSYSRAIQSLKRDVMDGKFGQPLRLKTLCLWPRDEAYYKRNDWAGRLKDDQGQWVLDSPANNAMAHFLHNLFYILGKKIDGCAMPTGVTAELYRAYPIENYDTCACRAYTDERVEILFYASHATYRDLGPVFSLEFEKASVTFNEAAGGIIAKDRLGNTENYSSPEAEHPLLKLFHAVKAVRESQSILCGPEASAAQTLCMNGMQESVSAISDFPDSQVISGNEHNRIWVPGLCEEMEDCYRRGLLPSEAGLSWAACGEYIDLKNYGHYPGSG